MTSPSMAQTGAQTGSCGLVLREAREGQDMDLVRDLFREYQAGLGEDLCFQNFEAELATLPGKYRPPQGTILLAWDDAVLSCAGIVAVRPVSGHECPTCEMKRLYVRETWRGRGVGRLLAEGSLSAARAMGYQSMVLDTLERLSGALTLYTDLGFVRRSSYYDNPLSGVVYMERLLD